jgi:hypothetical protein
LLPPAAVSLLFREAGSSRRASACSCTGHFKSSPGEAAHPAEAIDGAGSRTRTDMYCYGEFLRKLRIPKLRRRGRQESSANPSFYDPCTYVAPSLRRTSPSYVYATARYSSLSSRDGFIFLDQSRSISSFLIEPGRSVRATTRTWFDGVGPAGFDGICPAGFDGVCPAGPNRLAPTLRPSKPPSIKRPCQTHPLLGQPAGERHIRLLAPLAFLSPLIIAAIADGTAPADCTLTGLAKALPYSWAEQERAILRTA